MSSLALSNAKFMFWGVVHVCKAWSELLNKFEEKDCWKWFQLMTCDDWWSSSPRNQQQSQSSTIYLPVNIFACPLNTYCHSMDFQDSAAVPLFVATMVQEIERLKPKCSQYPFIYVFEIHVINTERINARRWMWVEEKRNPKELRKKEKKKLKIIKATCTASGSEIRERTREVNWIKLISDSNCP